MRPKKKRLRRKPHFDLRTPVQSFDQIDTFECLLIDHVGYNKQNVKHLISNIKLDRFTAVLCVKSI